MKIVRSPRPWATVRPLSRLSALLRFCVRSSCTQIVLAVRLTMVAGARSLQEFIVAASSPAGSRIFLASVITSTSVLLGRGEQLSWLHPQCSTRRALGPASVGGGLELLPS